MPHFFTTPDPALLLPLSALFPVALAALTALPHLRRLRVPLLPVAALPALLTGLLLPTGTRTELPHTLMAATWELDSLGRIFLIFTALVWFAAACHSIPLFKAHPRASSFAFPFLIAMAGNLCLILAADAVTFYTGFGVMSFASWGLVVHSGTAEARQAGRVYLALVVLGELLVFPGLVQGARLAGTPLLSAIRDHWIHDPNPRIPLALLFFGFSLKVGLFPFHFWLPLAHPAAPAPASAVLSGCMIKTGVLAWLRVLPIGQLAMPELARIIAPLASAGLLGALLIGLTQAGPKAMLAYSSLAKMSLVTLLLVPGIADPELAGFSVVAAVTMICLHAFHKSALFLGAPLTVGWSKWAWVPLGLLCASFAGVPGLGGSLAKTALNEWNYNVPESFSYLLGVIALSFFLTFPFLGQFMRKSAPGSGKSTTRRAPAATWLLAVGIALLFPLWSRILNLPVDRAYARAEMLSPDPVIILGVLAGVAGVLLPELRFHLPPGDVFAWLPRVPRSLQRRLRAQLHRWEHDLNRAPGGLAMLVVTLLLVGWMVLRP